MMGVSIITGVKTSAATVSVILTIIGIITGVKTSAATVSVISTITVITIEIIIGIITETMASAVTITETMVSAVTASAVTITETMVSAATASVISTITVIITGMTASAVTVSVRAIDPDRDLMAGETIKADLATRVLRADLCRKARLKMPRSIEMRRNAASVRRRISGTVKI